MYVKKKEDILTFLKVLGYYFISHEKSGHVLKKGRMAALLNNAAHMRPAQISDAKSTSNE